MKSRLLKATMALGLLLVGLGVSVATAANQKPPILVPAVGTTMTIGDIARLINRSTATTGSLSAQPIMLAPNNGKVPLKEHAYKTLTNFTRMGSVSPVYAQPTPAVDLKCQPANTARITLMAATPAHIAALMQRAAGANREKLQKCLLYFEYQGYAMFPFVDPWTSTLVQDLSKFRTI